MFRLLISCLSFGWAIGLSGQVLYVDYAATGQNNGASWVNAFTNLHDALEQASPGNMIWVAQGAYSSHLPNVSNSFNMPSGVRLLGGFAGTETYECQRDWLQHETILYGGNVNIGSTNILYCENTDSTTLVDGFTFRNGAAIPLYGIGQTCEDSPNLAYCHGGGIYLYNENPATPSFLTVRNCFFTQNYGVYGAAIAANLVPGTGALRVEKCRFEDNYPSGSTDTGGGGVLDLYTGAATPFPMWIDSCIFFNNTAYVGGGSIAVLNYSNALDLKITHCRIENNHAQWGGGGAGVSSSGKKILFKNCVFKDNTGNLDGFFVSNGGGIAGSTFRAESCVFLNNRADEGGGIAGRNIEVFNCLFANNHASEKGGGIKVQQDALLINNTFVGNTADLGAGAIYAYFASNDSIINCVFWNNIAGAGENFLESAHELCLYIDNCIIAIDSCASLWDGVVLQYSPQITCGSNMLWNLDPLLRDTAGGDYRPTGCSPALNRGDSAWTARFGLQTDLAGVSRWLDGLPDIGAYETPEFRAVVNHTDVSCFGQDNGTVTAQASGGLPPYHYVWNTGAEMPSLMALPSGTYVVTIRDADLCADTLSASVSSPAPFAASATITDASAAASADGVIALDALTGGTPPYALLWSNGDTTQTTEGLPEGVYQLTVRDVNDCDTTFTYEVGVTLTAATPLPGDLRIAIAPNPGSPASADFTLTVNSVISEKAEMVLISATGQVMRRNLLTIPAGISQFPVRNGLPSGVYLLQLNGLRNGRQALLTLVVR